MKALVTRKLGMMSIIGEDGVATAVTLLSAAPNTVTQIKTTETDGYNALQVGTEKAKKLNKAAQNHFKKSKVSPKVIRELRITGELPEDLIVGSQLGADVFKVGDKVKVTATSKGKGFTGVVKRHGFALGGKTHGGRSYRRPGSIGSMYPQKIFKGKKMAGHAGHAQVTTKNLTVALVDKEQGVIGLRGAVPGPRRGIVLIRGDN